MELNPGMLNKKIKCPTISKEPRRSFQAYSRHIYFQVNRWLKRCGIQTIPLALCFYAGKTELRQ